MSTVAPLLEVRDLEVQFPVRSGTMRRAKWLRAVDGISFSLTKGSTLGIVGESGSGKTTLARAVLDIYRPTSGLVLYKGTNVADLRGDERRHYRHNVQAVFQDPSSSLNPRMRVGRIIADPLIGYGEGNRREQKARVAELLESVGLDQTFAHHYPNQLSEGQRQRVAIARALALHPELLILDEPVSSLDVSIAAQILNLLKRLQRELGLTYMLIAHDLGVVRYLADEIAVVYLGQIVEQARSDDLIDKVKAGEAHPYTEALFAAANDVDDLGKAVSRVTAIGEIPSPINPPAGCRFHTRCPYVMEVCMVVPPLLESDEFGGRVACHLRPVATDAQVVVAGPAQRSAEIPVVRVHERTDRGGCHADNEPLLRVRGLTTEVKTRFRAFNAVDGIDFDIWPGETLGLVGESGSGKTLTALSMLGVLPQAAEVIGGEVLFRGEDLLRMSEERLQRRIRGNEIAMILQDPLSSLNPVFTVGSQLVEAVQHNTSIPRSERVQYAVDLMDQVRISEPETRMKAYPHQLSGGMRQRVVGAIALSGRPSLLIADEPTTSLDTTIQAQYLELLSDLQQETGMAILFITHDLGIVTNLCDRVAVMYAGRIVEEGPVTDVFADPRHPYTRGLLDSVPRIRGDAKELKTIPGQPAGVAGTNPGCRFAQRCEFAWELCRTHYPPAFDISDDRHAACWLNDPGVMPLMPRSTVAPNDDGRRWAEPETEVTRNDGEKGKQ